VVNSNITLNSTVTPAAISFNNTLIDYTLGGSGDITGTTGLSKGGTGGLTISNANTFSGNTVISGGYIEMQNAAALGTTGAIAVSQSGAALRLSGGIAVGAKALSLIGSGIANGGALRNVSGNNSYAGVITLNAAARINSDAGMLTLTGGITNGSNALTFGGAGDILETGVIGGGDGTLTVDGTGTVTLSNNANTYTGQTFIKSGTLSVSKIGSVGVPGGLGTPTFVANGTISIGNGANIGTLKWTGSANEFSNRAIDLVGTTGGATLDASGTGGAVLTLTGSLAFSGLGDKTLTLTGTGGTTGAPNVLAGTIGDSTGFATSLLKTGNGVWRLDGGGNYTGSTTINGGTLMLGISDSMPVNAPIIANGSGSATLNLNGFTQTFNGLTFGGASATSTAQGVVALGSSSTLTLGGNVTYSATGNPLGASITGSGAATLDLGGDEAAVAPMSRVFNVGSSSHSGGADLTISAVIADAGGVISGFANGITKTGTGTLVLTGANTYAGATTVDGGVLSVNSAALGFTSSINVGTTGTPGQLNFYADNSAAEYSLATDANLNVGGASSAGTLGFNLSGASGSDTIIITDTAGGADRLTVGAGGGVINARVLAALSGTSYLLIDNATNVAYAPTTITNFSLGVLTGGYTYALDNNTDGLLKLTVGTANASPYYWNGSLSGSWATLGSGGAATNWRLNQDGSGEAGATPGGVDVNFVTDTAANVNTTLDQPYAISGLNFLSNASGTGNVTIAAGSGDGTLTIGANGINVQASATSTSTLITAPVILGAAQSWNISDSNKILTVSGVVSGNGSLLTKTGAGTLVLSGVNTYNGGTTINGGTVQINHAGGLGAIVGDVTINAATLQATADITDSRNVSLGNSGSTILVDSTMTLSFTNTGSTLVSGNGVLNATGAGTLVLDDTLNANTFSGGSILGGGGTVRVYTATGIGSGAMTLNDATLRVSGTFTDGRNFTLGSAASAISIDSGRTLTLTNTISTKITGSGTLNASGAGTLVLDDSANANDFTGGSVLSGGGTVRITTDSSLGAVTGSVTIADAVLQVTQDISSSRSVMLGDSSSTILVDATKTYQIINTGSTNISGTGSLNVTALGTLVLDDTLNANTFSGGSVIDGGGTVQIATATSLGASSGIVTINNATLQATQNINSARNFLLGSYGSKVLVDATKTYTVNGTINDGVQTGTLNKLGGGTLTLTGANGYTGGTFVTAGALLVNNTSGSGTGTGDVSVTGAGTIFGGTGSVSGMVTIGSGAVLAPGTSVGTLTMAGLTLSAGSVLNYELGAVASSDKTSVTSSNGFTANGGVFNLTVLSGFSSGTYNLITYIGTLGGSFSNLSLASSYLTDLLGNVYFAQLVNNAGSVDLISTNNVVWNGNIVGAIWDAGATANTNWQSGTTTNINFYDTMAAVFDDTATNFTVNIPGTVTPSSITVNSANDYTFQGAGAITGATGIAKSGGGMLTISSANSFSGNVLLNAGSIEMRDPAALGTGTISITPGASLRLNSASAINLGTRITSYSGGAAIVNVSGNNSATLPNLALTAATSFISDSGTLTLAGNITSSSLALSLLGNGNITLTGASINIANSVFTVNTGGTVTVAGTIATGTSGVVINGTGTTLLNGTVTSTSTSAAGLNVTSSGTNTFAAAVSV
ncbi:MAG: autotransporter-associated beta strand repeat-containing protein, partial [Gammaproteobacteria bacterium]|nr:autotransporter-associated beta strand repeat-containing protein [Gammaproteobacteria bacterium]